MAASPRGLVSLAIAAMFVAAALAGVVQGSDPAALDLGNAWESPSWAHLCGRDGFGRDVLARLLAATATTLGIVALALACALVIAFILGGFAGWRGGVLDAVLMRAVDLVMGIRGLVLAVAVTAIIGPGVPALVVILALGSAPPLIRFVRSLVLAQSVQAHILAARALGATASHQLLWHVLPNIAGPVVVRGIALTGGMIQVETALSFLGVGAQDPAASLGTLVRDGLAGLRIAPHLAVESTVVIFLVVLFFILLSDELRDAMDPRYGGVGRRRQADARVP
jgi:peptide/nickel transport system permease protein